MQLSTVSNAPAPKQAVQTLVQHVKGPAQAALPLLAAFAPAALALAALELLKGELAPELAANAQEAGPDAASAAPGDPRLVEVFKTMVVKVPPILWRVDFYWPTM